MKSTAQTFDGAVRHDDSTTVVDELPLVSVIMPIRNEARFIERSLAAVLDQDYPADRLEVIVADGMSTDSTRDIVQAMQARHPHLHLIDNHGGIVPTGMNEALMVTRGDIIVRVDGHCEVEPDYVSRCVEHIRRDEADGVGGPIQTVGETTMANVIAVAMSTKFGVGGSAFRTVTDKTMPADTVPFPAYTRAAIELAGPYDEELVRNQDDEYNYRLRKLGAKILLAADVRSRYHSRGSLRSLWRQYLQYGFWKVRVLQKHPRQMKLRQFAPPVFVIVLLVALAASLVSKIGAWVLLAVLGGYVLANLVTSVVIAVRTSWRYLPLLPVTFATLHFAYGIGFLAGLVRFAGRWQSRKTK